MSDEENGALIIVDLAHVEIDEKRFELIKKALEETLMSQLIKLELASAVKFDWKKVIDIEEIKLAGESRRLKQLAEVQLEQVRRGQTTPIRRSP